MNIETNPYYENLIIETKKIANELIDEYGGKYVTKGGIRHKYKLGWVKATDTIKVLINNFNFIEINRYTLKVPLQIAASDSSGE